MPAVQTTYASVHAPAFVGMVANQEPRTVISRVVASAVIAFGAPVCRGATDDSIVAFAAASAYLGFAIVDPLVVPGDNDGYAQTDIAAVMTKGVLWTTSAVAVVAGQPVYVDANANITDVASGDTAIINAVFDSSAQAGGLVKIRLS